MTVKKVRISPEANSGAVRHAWLEFARNRGLDYEWVPSSSPADIVIGGDPEADVFVSSTAIDGLYRGVRRPSDVLTDRVVRDPHTNRIDYLTTALYLMNGYQEHDVAADRLDALGRFEAPASVQAEWGALEQNLVQEVFDTLGETLDLPAPSAPSRVFLSHDIDSVYDAYRQDGLASLKRGRVDQLAKLLLNAAIGRPDWLNMDRIMAIETEHDMVSTFYWLANRGRINAREVNADYAIDDPKIVKAISDISDRGWENGLHKSISPDSVEAELDKLPFRAEGNRYHYLKYRLPDGFRALERAGVRFDSSMGFAEAIGFRNSYGRPFNPYDLSDDRPLNLVEAPLHIMDFTLSGYLGLSPEDSLARMVSFIDAHRENCVLSILWHNTFFGDIKYRGFLDVYKRTLGHLRDIGLRSVSQRELIDEFSDGLSDGSTS